LNWQTTNSLSQNNLLRVIERKVDKLTETFQYQLNQMSEKVQKSYSETKQKIEVLEKEMEKTVERSFHESTRKEQELQTLRKQVSEIEEYVKTIAKPSPPENIYSPFPISPQKLLTNIVIQHPVKPPFLPPNLPEQTTIFGRKNKEKVVVVSHITPQEEIAPKEKSLSQLMVTLKEEIVVAKNSKEEYEEASEISELEDTEASLENNSKKEFANLSKIFMVSHEESLGASTSGLHSQEVNTPPQRIVGTPLFSLDDIPPAQWRKKLLDFKAWMDAKMIDPDADRYRVIEEFCAWMTGTLKKWYQSIGTVNQDQLHRFESMDVVISAIHRKC